MEFTYTTTLRWSGSLMVRCEAKFRVGLTPTTALAFTGFSFLSFIVDRFLIHPFLIVRFLVEHFLIDRFLIDHTGSIRNMVVSPGYNIDGIPGTRLPEIKCSAQCSHTCQYTWTRNSDRALVSQTPLLDLGVLENSEVGSYTCTAVMAEMGLFQTISIQVNPVISGECGIFRVGYYHEKMGYCLKEVLPPKRIVRKSI